MNKLNKLTITAIHLVVWIVLFVLPFLLSSGNNDALALERSVRHTLGPLILCAIVFYANYLFLIGRFLLRKQFVVYFLINVMLFAALILLKQMILMNLFMDAAMRPDSEISLPKRLDIDMLNNASKVPIKQIMLPPRKFFIYLDTLSLIIPLIFSIALKMGERWLKIEADKKEAENIKLQSEIQHLKYQLQPHFFFNSLNNIYSLVDISPDKAKETIHSLGKLMRYLLYESNAEKVELKREIEFLERYIELMNLRSSDNVTVKSNFSNVPASVKIAPLLFISLIENAFKHGVSATEESEIEIELKEENGIVNFYSKNKNFSKSDDDKSGSGIGLENLRKRLELIYPGKYIFKINDDGNDHSTRLIINTK